jgi:hypothetical protein
VGDRSLVYTSRVFQPNTPFIDNSFHFVGPSILTTTRTHTDFPWDLLDRHRPRVYLSLGTLYSNNLAFYRTVFTAFANHPAQFILAVGHQTDLHSLVPIPDNFIVQPVVPQLELLPKIDVFVTHGGMNSVNEGLYFGLPLVVVPQQIEQVFNARQVARTGAGVVVADTPPYGRVNAHLLRQAVDQVLADATYRNNAAHIRDSFHAAGGYRQAASVITAAIG